MTYLNRSPLLLAICVIAAGLAAPGPARAEDPPGQASVRSYEHHYRMTGRIRPLLFWITRDDVGGARLVRRADGDTVRFELLIGTAPERAPRRVNRWGYFLEESGRNGATVFGLMTSTDQDSLEAAERQRARDGTIFGIVRASIGPGESIASTTTLATDRDLTYRDLDDLLEIVGARTEGWNVRRVPRGPGVRAGFMTALQELMDASVRAHAAGGPLSRGRQDIAYVYKEALYDMRLREARFREDARFRDRTFANVIQGSFEIRNRFTGHVTRFQIAYGASGALAGIPVHMVYRPNFWFEAELVLDEDMRFEP